MITEAFDTSGWGNDNRPGYSPDALGDQGCWTWWLPLAWHAVVDPGASIEFPPSPERAPGREVDLLYYRAAYWAPLFHLTCFGLGWQRPDLGLARWLEQGAPTDDPILRVIGQWWGVGVENMLAWTTDPNTAFPLLVGSVDAVIGMQSPKTALRDRWKELRQTQEWGQILWGPDPDGMHLQLHGITPVEGDSWLGEAHVRGDEPELIFLNRGKSQRAVLMLDSYVGWYRHLHALGATLPDRDDGHAWRVDVVVRPLGFLGTYRRSWESGRWFSGQHRWHTLGS